MLGHSIAHRSYSLQSSGRADAIERGNANSTQAGDAALVAWLDSLAGGDVAGNEGDSLDTDSGLWSDESSDSLDSIDTVFEALGAAAA